MAESRVESEAEKHVAASASGDVRGGYEKPRDGGATRRRRRFSAEYKLEILRRVDACTERGEIGALLRAEGLFFSHLTNWRRERQRGALDALRGRRSGPRTAADKAIVDRLAEIEREVRVLRTRLERAERRLAGRQGSLHKTDRAL